MSEGTMTILILAGEATLILAAGLCASAWLRSRPAAAHAAVLAALIAVLALPMAAYVAARAGWGLLPSREDASLASLAPREIPAAPIDLDATPARAGVATVIAPAVPSSAIPAGVLPDGALPTVPASRPASNISIALVLERGLLAAWGLASAILLARLIAGVAAGMRIRRGSRVADHPAAMAALRRAAREVGVAWPVELRVSSRVACPVISCFGWPRCVLIPEACTHAEIDWKGVMAHELAHLRRRDHLWTLVAEMVVCALPWHPLAWAARRRLGALAERACDDWALRSAASETSYADSLVAFAPGRAGVVLAPAIVSRAGLTARVARILSGRRAPARVGRGVMAAVALAAASGVAIAALARPGSANREAEHSKAQPGADGEPVDVPTQIQSLLEYWRRTHEKTSRSELWQRAKELGATGDPRVIPPMIAIIDADESYDTIYGIGYFGLAQVTGVEYSPFHDGAWWRRWWEKNKQRFPEAVRDAAFPDVPMTESGRKHVDYPESLDTFEGKIEWMLKEFRAGKTAGLGLMTIAQQVATHKDPRAIPVMIAIIDADNSEDTVYVLGHFGLSAITGVKYSPFHDGPWWIRWWERNKSRFPTAENVPIPVLEKTAHGRTYIPMPKSFETLDGKVEWLVESLRAGRDVPIHEFAEAMMEHHDARAVPTLIGLMEAEPTEDAAYSIGYFGLRHLTKVEYDESHDAKWWRAWWEENKGRYPVEAQRTPIPNLKALVKDWRGGEAKRKQERIDAEFAGFPSQDLRIGGDERKRYFLMGPAANQQAPKDGWKLLLILPGGAGGADFHHFCRVIARDALPEGYIAAQLVAPAWTDDPNRTVWPTRMLNPNKAEFTTEDFIRDVVKDVGSRMKIDPARVFALGWSSSGPALYCDSLQADTPITGWFIAMSVFRPEWMPDIAGAKGKSYFLFHSPDERMIPIDKHARVAETKLREAGARVKLVEYAGGHGWTDDPLGNIRRGVEWLESGEE